MTETAVSTLKVATFRAAELLPQREEWLVSGLTAALPSLKMAELFALRRDMFRDADLITVATEPDGGSAFGVLSSRWTTLPSGRRLLHILTQFVGERYQNGVAFRQSWISHFDRLHQCGWRFPELLVLKTYNPIAYCAMAAFARVPSVTIYPDMSAKTQDPEAVRLATEVARALAHGHPFDPRTGVIHDAGVPRDLYPRLPRSSSAVVNAYFEATVSPGDRLLAMLQVPTPRAAEGILTALAVRRGSA